MINAGKLEPPRHAVHVFEFQLNAVLLERHKVLNGHISGNWCEQWRVEGQGGEGGRRRWKQSGDACGMGQGGRVRKLVLERASLVLDIRRRQHWRALLLHLSTCAFH